MTHIESENENIPDEMTMRLGELSDSLMALKRAEKEIKNKIDIKRGEFEMIVDNYGIEGVETEISAASISTSERFSKWDNIESVFDQIPRRMQTIKTMTPDIKKIRIMVKNGKLPEEILKSAKMSSITRMTFKPVQED